MNLEQTTDLYASVLRQLLPVGGYDTSPNTEALAVDVYAHAKLLAQADLDAKRILSVLEAIPQELINEYELEYGLPLKCTVNASRTFEERLQILNWVRTSRNVLNRSYLEQLLAIFGVTLIDIQKFRPILCTASCTDSVNTEQLRYKVFLRLQYPMNADMSCIVENYLPGYLRIEWMVDMPWGDWILNPTVTVNTNGVAHYTAYKTNQREYYDSYADLDLTAAIIRSLSDSDMQLWQAVKDACNSLSGGFTYFWDSENKRIKYIDLNLQLDPLSPTQRYYYIYTMTGGNQKFSKMNDVCLMAFTDGGWAGNVPPIPSKYGCKLSGNSIVAYAPGGELGGVGARVTNPFYDLNAPDEREKTIPFLDIAQKIISNSHSTNQAISLLAETYLGNIAQSIFNSEESKRFVKITDITSQFEPNKTLRT